jgi:hypothetical protein
MTGPGRTYRAGDEKSYLDIADHPVNIKAGEISMQSHYFGKMPAFDRAEKIIEKQRASTVPVQSE